MSLFKKIFGDPNEGVIKSLRPLVEKINAKESETEKLSGSQLKDSANLLRGKISNGSGFEDLLVEAFALVRESAKRNLKQRHFDVQLMGGIVLHRGQIAEMKTGEGKTLVATLPSFFNALKGQVHVITVNDYLARRDAVWMGQIHYALGLKVACINNNASFVYDPAHINSNSEKSKSVSDSAGASDLDSERDSRGSFKVVYEFLRPVEKKEAYEADIIYGTNSEFGFDYLRDNLAYDYSQIVQKKHWMAIVDEVDSILIDEARTPLIISAPDTEAGELYQRFAVVARQLKENAHYNIDEKKRSVVLTEEGINFVENLLGHPGIYEAGNIRLAHHLEQAVRAQALFHRDRDYVVKDGEVVIVDEFTGRLLAGRRYSEGLHQAIEAKEGVKVQKESRTMATITFQNYFRMYEKLAGMTGTALTNAEEFHKVYKLEVVSIPTNKPMVRKDLPDVIYKTEKAKYQAVIAEIKKRNEMGQPVLCGTTSIEKNEKLSLLLKREGISHQVLNAKNHEAEAQTIAQAGKPKSVTIATNMAGRGVDIILGGNPPDPKDREKVLNLGGLFVIGTERHEARRIDNQLRGRAGRQGDPGMSQFFLSLEDDVVRIFGGDRIKNLMEKFGLPDDLPITNSLVSKSIEQAQSKIEGYNFDIRKYVLEFDDVMNKQRTFVYRKRHEILKNPEILRDEISQIIDSESRKIVRFHTSSMNPEEWNLEEVAEVLKAWTGQEWHSRILDRFKTDPVGLGDWVSENLLEKYQEKEDQLGSENMRMLEKGAMLQVIDLLWLEHLEQMEHLRNSVNLRSYGQQDPLVEYKKEGLRLFKQLQEAIPALIVANIFKIGVAQIADASASQKQINQVQHKQGNAGDTRKIGRNDPCWCGSGKKYKKCHGK